MSLDEFSIITAHKLHNVNETPEVYNICINKFDKQSSQTEDN